MRSIYSEYTFTPQVMTYIFLFYHKPSSQINPVSQELKRDLNHLYKWKDTIEKKKEMHREVHELSYYFFSNLFSTKLKYQIEQSNVDKKVYTDRNSEQMVSGTRPKMAIEDLLLAKEKERQQKIQKLGDKLYGNLGSPRITEKASKLQPSMKLLTRLYELPLEKTRAKSSRAANPSRSASPSFDKSSHLNFSKKNQTPQSNNLKRVGLANSNVSNSSKSIYKNYAQGVEKQGKPNGHVKSLAGAPLLTIDQLRDEEAEKAKKRPASKKSVHSKASIETPVKTNRAKTERSEIQTPSESILGDEAKLSAREQSSAFSPITQAKKFAPRLSGEKLRMPPNLTITGKQGSSRFGLNVEKEPSSIQNISISPTALGLAELGFSRADLSLNSGKLKGKDERLDILRQIKTPIAHSTHKDSFFGQKQPNRRAQSPEPETSLSIFERSKEWLNNKSSKLTQHRAALQKKEEEACTFKPQIKKNVPSKSPSQSQLKKITSEKVLATYSSREPARRVLSSRGSDLAARNQLTKKEIFDTKNSELLANVTPTLLEKSLKEFETADLAQLADQTGNEPWTSIYQDLEKQKKLINIMLDSDKKDVSQS